MHFQSRCPSKVEGTKVPALFDSRVEAAKGANSFNFTGAYKIGNEWMPCATHESHKSILNKNIKDQNHHHHHH